MSSRTIRTWGRSVVVLAALGCAAGAARAAAGAPERPRYRVLRTWQDTVKVDGVEVARRVEVVFDYVDGVAREVAYDLAGKVLGSVTIVHGQPRPSQEEIEEAGDIIRGDVYLGRILARTGGRPHGTFSMEEPEGRACGPRTRCLLVMIVSPDGRGLLRRVVVDLTRRAVVYRAYVPEETEVAK